MKEYSTREIKDVLIRKNYVFFERGNYNLNIIGVRNDSRISGAWDDALYLIYKENNIWIKRYFLEFTTDPGTISLTNPTFPEARRAGVAIMKEGQYRGAYALGFHQNNRNHPALIQVRPVECYRDNNRDNILDLNTSISTGLYGLNIHGTMPNYVASSVHNWSAGCQVFRVWNEHLAFIRICREAEKVFGNSFTYTLLHQSDFE